MPLLVRIEKYLSFLNLVNEHFGGGPHGFIKKEGMVWFKIGRKRVYLQLRYKAHYGMREWGGRRFMVYEMAYIRVHKIGKRVIPYNLAAYDICVPAEGYIHEDSKLYEFLDDLERMSKKIG